MPKRYADVCLILEGTYPYVPGGVSQWTHDLIQSQSHLTFHLVTLLPPNADAEPVFELPKNVLSVTDIRLQDLPLGTLTELDDEHFFNKLEDALRLIQHGGGLRALEQLAQLLEPYRGRIGAELLLNSKGAWEMMVRMYESSMPSCSMLDYFWSWRALLGGLYSVLLADLPSAEVYHTLCTGYAGVYAARAHLETEKPALLTEHGIYTNERRIEIALADWLFESHEVSFTIDKTDRDVRDLWMDSFSAYSLMCYEACDQIITLFEGNFPLQITDGADPEKLSVIPNGIDYERFSALTPSETGKRQPTIALIGRVVPIKDVKTFVRACARLKAQVPDIKAYIMGGTDEDPRYYDECRLLIQHLSLNDTITFTGKVDITKYLPEIDVVVLTSISEAQPLVILEVGAAGIPTVATDVGACREMIEGRSDENPVLGPGGAITPISNPKATAQAIQKLLADREWYAQCSTAIRARTRTYYNRADQRQAYANLYGQYLNQKTAKAA